MEDDPQRGHDEQHDETEPNQPAAEPPPVGGENDATFGRGFEQPEPIPPSTTTASGTPSMWQRILHRLTGKS